MPLITIQGRSLYYEWRGDSAQGSTPGATPPVIVFLHDGLGAVGSWKDVPERIANPLGARALVFDRWGYGRSAARPNFPFRFMEAEVEPLHMLLAGLGVRRAFLVGHSDGGSIALLFASRYPGAVAAIVTEAAHVFVEPETQAGIAALVTLQRAGRTPAWLTRLHGERADALLSAWADGWLTEEHARWRITSELPGIRCPLLAIQGEQDEFGTPEQVEAIRRGVPHAESWMVPACGHTPHTAAKEEFERRAIAFLSGQGLGAK